MNELRKAVPSILRTTFCFVAWGILVHAFFVAVLWIFAKWDLKAQLSHPLLSPLNGLRLWVAMGILWGWVRRNKKPISTGQWSRTLLYMLFFAAFISTLQIYYVHRKNTGWYDMKGTDRCYNKYHSFWLIQDKPYFRDIDECLQGRRAAKKDVFGNPSFVIIKHPYNNESGFKPRLIDYDVITPRLLWILIAFIIVTIIELIRQKGLIRFSKYWGSYFSFGSGILTKRKGKQIELLFLGITLNVLALFFLPKIDGYPSAWVPLILLTALLILSFRLYVERAEKLKKQYELPSWFLLIAGAIICNILLVFFGLTIMYYLFILSLAVYLVTTKKLPVPAVKAVLFILLFFDPTFLWADDGTWSEGGLDRLLTDSAGPLAVNNTEALTDTVMVTLPLAVPEPPDEDGEISLTEEEIFGDDSNQPGTTTEQPAPTRPNSPIDRPLGEELPPANNNTNPE